MRLTFEPDLQAQCQAKLGFGTWGLGGNSYGFVSEENAKKLISYAYEKGICTFDTSPLYGDGRSESFLGEVLQSKPRSTYKLITKAGLYNSGAEELRDFSSNAINKSLDLSLSRLNTDHLDYFLLHSPTQKEILEGKANSYGLQQAISEGTIRNFGVSLKSPADYSIAKDLSHIRAIEFNYSLMDQRAEFLDSNDERMQSIYKIARTPYNFGFLTDTPPEKMPPTSPLSHLRNWSEKQFTLWHSFREIWAQIAQDNNLSLQDLALIFVLSSDFVNLVIPGFMKTEHIDSAINVAQLGPLTRSSRNYLIEVYLENESKFVVSK